MVLHIPRCACRPRYACQNSQCVEVPFRSFNKSQQLTKSKCESSCQMFACHETQCKPIHYGAPSGRNWKDCNAGCQSYACTYGVLRPVVYVHMHMHMHMHMPTPHHFESTVSTNTMHNNARQCTLSLLNRASASFAVLVTSRIVLFTLGIDSQCQPIGYKRGNQYTKSDCETFCSTTISTFESYVKQSWLVAKKTVSSYLH